MLTTLCSFIRCANRSNAESGAEGNLAGLAAALAVVLWTTGAALAQEPEPYSKFIEDADWAKIAAEPNVAMVIVVRLNEEDPDRGFETFVPREKSESEKALQFSSSGQFQDWLGSRTVEPIDLLAYHQGSNCVCKHHGTIVDVCD